ncbi:MAG: MATE family efflux transporter, partial [Intestinibaculum porci]
MRLHAKEMNMLEGPLLGKIVSYAIPLALASILQQLFNSADLAVIGRFEDSVAMAAVGANSSLVSLLVSLFSGLSLGSNVTIASFIGSGKKKDINKAIHTTIALSLVSGVILCIVGEIVAPQILKLMSTPDRVLALAVVYLRILFIALPFLLIYDFGASVLRAKGDSTRPLYILFLSGIINVILNIIFVGVFHLSVAGVALGTLAANVFSAFMIITFLRHEEETYRLHLKKLKIEKTYLSRIIAIGAPAGIQGMVFSLSNVIIQSGINSFGA